MDIATVNHYLAHKQHLLSNSMTSNLLQVTRKIVALHATSPVSPYLSLWARLPGFERWELEKALYEQRELVRILCMRDTLHVIPSEELTFFFQAYSQHHSKASQLEGLLVAAGLCQTEEASHKLEELQGRVLRKLIANGPSTVQTLSHEVPELKVKVQHSTGKPYEGQFSVGSRLVPGMCALGLLMRAKPRGTWRSNLYKYTPLSEWLQGIDLYSVDPLDARLWLVRRYLSAFGPVCLDDVHWWTGFSKGEVYEALEHLQPEIRCLSIEGLGDGYLMLDEDARQLESYILPDSTYVNYLPGLDPYIMGYRNRVRFLETKHNYKIFDRAGNAMPSVWVDNRVVGVWGQRSDGSVVFRCFTPVDAKTRAQLDEKRQGLDDFLDGELLPQPSRTAFLRTLST